MFRVIGLAGRKGAGKSAVAKLLVNEYGFSEAAFADPLKKGLQQLLGLEEDQLWGPRKDTIDPTWGVQPRQLLQYLGTEVFRDQLPQLFDWKDRRRSPWVFRMRRELERRWAEDPRKYIVISDIRFPDEAAFVHELGGRVWQVERPGQIGLDFHESEGRTDFPVDENLHNTGTLEDLHTKVRILIGSGAPKVFLQGR